MDHLSHDHYYHFGDVYETIDTCHTLERMLGRLQRQQLIDPEGAARSKASIAEIRGRLEHHIARAS